MKAYFGNIWHVLIVIFWWFVLGLLFLLYGLPTAIVGKSDGWWNWYVTTVVDMGKKYQEIIDKYIAKKEAADEHLQ